MERDSLTFTPEVVKQVADAPMLLEFNPHIFDSPDPSTVLRRTTAIKRKITFDIDETVEGIVRCAEEDLANEISPTFFIGSRNGEIVGNLIFALIEHQKHLPDRGIVENCCYCIAHRAFNLHKQKYCSVAYKN